MLARILENMYSERRETKETQKGSFLRGLPEWTNELLLVPQAFISGAKMVHEAKLFSSHPPCHHCPHAPSPQPWLLERGSFEFGRKCKKSSFSRDFEKQQLQPSQTPWKLINSFPVRLIALRRQWTHPVNIHGNVYSLFIHIYLSYLSLFRLLQSTY